MLIVYNLPSGEQRMVDVHPTGGIASYLETVWNEGSDGPLTPELAAQVGGLVRAGNSIQFSQDRKTQHDAAITANVAAANQIVLDELNALRRVKSFQAYSDQAKSLLISDITKGTAARFNAIKAAMLGNWETKAQRHAVWSQVPDAKGLEPSEVFDIIEAKNAIVVRGN